jgi:hypothetical protein
MVACDIGAYFPCRVEIYSINPRIRTRTMASIISLGVARLEMKREICGSEHADHRNDPEVAPVAARDDLAGRGAGEQEQERTVDGRRRDPPDRGRQGYCHSSRQPRGDKEEKRHALDRQSAGPIRCGPAKGPQPWDRRHGRLSRIEGSFNMDQWCLARFDPAQIVLLFQIVRN